MFNRATMQQIEGLTSGGGDAAINREENLARAVTLVLQEMLTAIVTARNLWDNGVGDLVAAAPTPDDAPAGSAYTQRQWLAWMAAQAAIVVATKTPLTTLASLAVTDGAGALVLDANGMPIMPFGMALDPVAMKALTATDSVESLIWKDPETV